MPRNTPPSAMVGLDIGTDSIKVAEAKRTKDGISITGLGIARVPEGVIDNEAIVDPKALGNAIKALLAESGIKTKQVTSSLAGESRVVIRVIEVPKMAPAELADTMKWEVERQVPFSPSEVVMDYQPLEKANADPNAQNMEVLLAVAQEDFVNSHVETLLAAGLKPVAIDIEPLAAGRALIDAAGNGAGDQIVAIVNIGARDTEFGIFESGILTFPSPPSAIAGESFTREISEALGQSLEQAETTKKEYASVNLDGFGGAPGPATTGAQPAPPGHPEPILSSSKDEGAAEPTSFDTSVGPEIQFGTAFDLGDSPAPAAEASELAAEPADLADFRDTVDGPVFDSPDLAIGLPSQPDAAGVGGVSDPDAQPESAGADEPAGPTFDLGDADADTAPTFDLGGDEPAAAPAGPVFDLDDEPAAGHPEPVEGAAPTLDLDDEPAAAADPVQLQPVPIGHSGGETIENRVFEAISGVLIDLANELRRSMEYYSTRYGRMPERVFLCGGTAKMPHLDEFLSREIGIPVEVADPVKNLDIKVPGVSDRYLREISPMFSVAVGLAIRDMVG